jgi:hypothetical protein
MAELDPDLRSVTLLVALALPLQRLLGQVVRASAPAKAQGGDHERAAGDRDRDDVRSKGNHVKGRTWLGQRGRDFRPRSEALEPDA